LCKNAELGLLEGLSVWMSQIQTIACLKDRQYKKEFYMRNLIKMLGIIAILAIIGLTFSCELDPEDQLMVTITGIPTAYNGKYASVGLAKSNNVNDLVAIARPKSISGGQVSNLEMLDDDGTLFVKDGNYYVVLLINASQDLTGEDLYSGISGVKALKKGSNSFTADLFYPELKEPSTPDPDKPSANNFGTYTTSVSYSAGGTSKNFTETIVLSENSFYIKDNTNGDSATPDDLTFKITSWEEATPPATIATTYPKAYKFSGKITGAFNDTSNADFTRGDYLPSSKTAPSTGEFLVGTAFAEADAKADESGPTCYMYIYFNGDTGNITFVRTSFTKSATGSPKVITDDAGANRVYTKSNN
jgi:hypothetical protein